MFRHIFLLVLTLHLSTAYVLLQVKKNEKNESDISALIHRVVPQIAAALTLNDTEKERFEIKKRADDSETNPNPTLRRDSKHTVLLINEAFAALKKITGGPEFRSSKTMSFIDKILDALKSFVNGPEFRSSKTMRYIEKLIDILKEAANGPEYRSTGKGQNMKTEIVHFRSGQPSLVFELKPNFFIDFIKKVLSAQLVERYMDDLLHSSRKAKKFRPKYN